MPDGPGVEQLSWATCARVRGRRSQPAVLGDSGTGLRALGVHHLSRATPAGAREPAVSTNSPGRLGPGSEGPRSRQAVPGDPGLGPIARGVDQQSRAPRASVRVPARMTQCLWGPGLLGDSGPLTRARGVDQLSRVTQPGSKSPRARAALPGHSCLGPMPLRVDQLSGVIRARAQGPAVSTTDPGQLRSGSEGLRGRPAVPGDPRLVPIARGFDQRSQATRASV